MTSFIKIFKNFKKYSQILLKQNFHVLKIPKQEKQLRTTKQKKHARKDEHGKNCVYAI